MNQLKKIAFLVARPGMSDQDFRTYWRNIHGPVVAGSPGYREWRLRYVQNHVLGPGSVGAPFHFAGMAEFWLPGEAPNEDLFSTTPIYQDRIRVDEMNFIDMDRTVSMSAIEHVITPGHGPIKLVVLSSGEDSLSQEAFLARFEADYIPSALANAGFSRLLRGWTANYVIKGTFRLPGARAVEPLPIDCIEEFWFDTREDLLSAFASSPEPAFFAARQSFVAEELVFFDAMID